MRLLNTHSLKLEDFVGDGIPKYAILSHRWEAEEILFEDVQTDPWPQKRGADKVKRACIQAKCDGFTYIWIDTCCIDKSSSAELSEAINSMFNWYHRSQVCYVYLFDVPIGKTEVFTRSVWFTRGWTLQELIAPRQVHFFDRQWRKIGDRLSLLDSIVKVTAIDRRILGRGQHHRYCGSKAENLGSLSFCYCGRSNGFRAFHQLLSSFSVATRMSWASKRVTTRVEDEAYALLGLFNVNMPLLYGEGTKAFRRLQEEIIRNSNDQSILAGQQQLCVDPKVDISGRKPEAMDDAFDHLFPSGPRAFRQTAHLERPLTSSKDLSMTLTNRCLNIDLLVCPCWWRSDKDESAMKRGWLGILACVYSDDYLSRPAILLDRLRSIEDDDERAFTRIQPFGKSLIRISAAALPDTNCEVEISAGELALRLNPSHIEMMNIDLLMQPPMWAQRPRTPAIRINPTIGEHKGRQFRIWMSLPELEETPDGHIRDMTFMIKSRQDMTDNVSGLLAISDGLRHRFFVAYGFSVPSFTSNEPPTCDPWCRLLEWYEVVGHPKLTRKDDVRAITFRAMVRFNSPYRGVLEPCDKAQTHDSMDWPRNLGLRAEVTMTPNTFLGQTVYEMEISVRRLR